MIYSNICRSISVVAFKHPDPAGVAVPVAGEHCVRTSSRDSWRVKHIKWCHYIYIIIYSDIYIYIIYHILYIIYCILYIICYILYIICYILYIIYHILYIIYDILHIVYYITYYTHIIKYHCPILVDVHTYPII